MPLIVNRRRPLRLISLVMLGTMLGACANFATNKMTHSLSRAIVNEDDPDTVRDGVPAYLLLIDGLILDDPGNQDLLVSGARLDSAYASAFVNDVDRAKRLTGKALDYGRRALCLRRPAFCAADSVRYENFIAALAKTDNHDLPAMYADATSWAGWLQVRSADPAALSDLPKVEAMLERIISLDENFENGQAHLYLGIMRSQLPAPLGGQPEIGKSHFERAIALSQGHNLLAKVEYAHTYARLMFDRPLHDRLLKEVLAADPVSPGYTLSNILAQRQARQLLDSADDYFGETP
jgi:TRAP transporter T-component